MSVTPHVALGRGARAEAADTAEAPLVGAPIGDSTANGESFGDVLAGERRATSDAPSPAPASVHEHKEHAARETAAPDAPAPTPTLVAAVLAHAPRPTVQHNDPVPRGGEGDGGDSVARAGDVAADSTGGAGISASVPAADAPGGTTVPARGMGQASTVQPDKAAASAIAAGDTSALASDGHARRSLQRTAATSDAAPDTIVPTPTDETAHGDRATPLHMTEPAVAGAASEPHKAADAASGPHATADAGMGPDDAGSLAPGRVASAVPSRVSATEAGSATASSRITNPATVPGQAARNAAEIAQGQAAGTTPVADAINAATASLSDAAMGRERGDVAISHDNVVPVVRQSSQQGEAATSADGAATSTGTRAGHIGASHAMSALVSARDDGAEPAGKAGERGPSHREMPGGIAAASQENGAADAAVGRGVTIGAERDGPPARNTTTPATAPLGSRSSHVSDDRAANDLPAYRTTEGLPSHDATASKQTTPADPLGAGLGESAALHTTGVGTTAAQAAVLLNGEARQGVQTRVADELSPATEQGAPLASTQKAARDSGPLDAIGRMASALRTLGLVDEEHPPHASGKSAAAPGNAEALASAVPLMAWLPALAGIPAASAGPMRPTAHSKTDSAIGAAGGAGVGHAATAGDASTMAPATRSRGEAQARQPDAWAALLPGGIQVTPHEHADAPAQPAPPTVERTVMTPISEGIFVRMGALRATPSWSSFHVVLQPQALGMVTVHMERSTAGLHVSILPQHAETQALLDKHLPELVAQLRAADPDGSLRVNVLPVNLTAPQHNAAATAAVQPAAATPDSGAFGGQGAQAQLGGQAQGFEQGHPPPEWRPPETAQARPAVPAATAAAPVSRPGPKGRITTARTARIDVQA